MSLASIDHFSVINVQFTAEQFIFIAVNQWNIFEKSFSIPIYEYWLHDNSIRFETIFCDKCGESGCGTFILSAQEKGGIVNQEIRFSSVFIVVVWLTINRPVLANHPAPILPTILATVLFFRRDMVDMLW